MRNHSFFRRSAVFLVLSIAIASAPSRSSAQTCRIFGPSSGCGSVVLCGPVGENVSGWEWFGPDGALISRSRCVEAAVSGRYGLIVVAPNGSRSERCDQQVTVFQSPACSIEGPARFCAGESARLCGPAGPFVYAWSGPAGFSATTPCVEVSEPGVYRLELRGEGEDCPPSICARGLEVETCVRNQPPDCSGARPSSAVLWPPNHELVPVRIEGVGDPDGDPVSVTITSITQDEPVEGTGDGDAAPDARVDGAVAWLRAERGQGDGRVYAIGFTANDGQGGECSGRVQVCVPRSSEAPGCTDDGGRFSSFEGSTARGMQDLRVRERRGKRTVLEYRVAGDADVRVDVLDITGRRITVLERGRRGPGTHQVEWNATGAPRGVYRVHLKTSAGQNAHTLVCLP